MCAFGLQNKDYILHHCDNCPNMLVLENFITCKLRENHNLDDAKFHLNNGKLLPGVA